MKTNNYISTDGLANLKTELTSLKAERDNLLVEMRVSQQQENGDTSENSEYMRLEAELTRVQTSIGSLSEYIADCAVVNYLDKVGQDSDKVRFGCKVAMLNTETDVVTEYRILGEKESDPKNGVISHKSPLGVALVGKEVGDYVDFLTPSQVDIEFEIKTIRY